VRTFDEGFDSFLFVPVLLAFSGCSPLRWQPLKASRTLRCTPCFAYCLRIALRQIRLFAAGIGLRAFYGALRPMPAMQFGRIDSRYAADLYLSTYFSAASAPLGFSGRKIAFFPAFAAHLCGMCKISLGESYFPPNHNRFTIKQLQTARTARNDSLDIKRRTDKIMRMTICISI